MSKEFVSKNLTNGSARPARILIVDDKEKIRSSLSLSLGGRGFETVCAAEMNEAWEKILIDSVDLALIDIMLGEDNGLELLKKIRKLDNPIPVLMFTGYGTIETAIEAIQHGAFNYLQKPVKIDQLVPMIRSALRLRFLEQENKDLQSKIAENGELILESGEMQELAERAVKLAPSELPILIQGESGTGKELFAELIHSRSERRDKPLIKINCAALPDSLLDDELFGHEKGAFTGAEKSYCGVFERAHGGTLFLDELGDMSLATQAKILRAIQNREIKRLGASGELEIDVRFIAATNKNLDCMMKDKSFREDLYYRLSTAVLILPPLRQRRNEILRLANHFLSQGSDETLQSYSFDAEATDFLVRYEWPGNVRELKSTIQYARAVAASPLITLKDLPRRLTETFKGESPGKLHQEMEEDLIRRILSECGGNKKRSAEILGISRATLYNKIREYGLA